MDLPTEMKLEMKLYKAEELAIQKCKEKREALRIKREYEKSLDDKNLPGENEEIIYNKIEKKEPRIKYIPCDINCRGCNVVIPSDVLGIMKHMGKKPEIIKV